MTDNEIIKAWDILCKFDFFGGQRAGRELWNEKPADIQDKDIETFSNDVAFLKDLINRQKAEKETMQSYIDCLKAEIERLELENRVLSQKRMNFFERLEIVQETRAEAVKEFAERLCEDRLPNDPVVIAVKCELKEMVGEADV